MITRILNPATNKECYCLMFSETTSFDEINETRKAMLDIITCLCSIDENNDFQNNKYFYKALSFLSEMELSEDQSFEIHKLMIERKIK